MFKSILQTIVEQTPGAQSAILMGCDGIAVESYTTDGGNEDNGQAVVVEFASVVREVAHTAGLLSVGELEEIAIKCENMVIILTMLTPEYFVALLLDSAGVAAKGRYVVRRDAHKLRAALE
jgi:predicted regulator of Ras-like GTPase activity (Roadblock/LC7/MglB family)